MGRLALVSYFVVVACSFLYTRISRIISSSGGEHCRAFVAHTENPKCGHKRWKIANSLLVVK